MTLAAFVHGYPPHWSMGGEVSTHRTLRELPDVVVFSNCEEEYVLDGVRVKPYSGDARRDVESVDADIVFTHSTMSATAVSAARVLGLPSILAVHAPPRYATDLRRAWSKATVRLYNTETARHDWHDPKGWVLHPPAGEPVSRPGPHDALTLTSSLRNKGAREVLRLAEAWPDRRFIIVRSPAHETHGDSSFDQNAAALPNVEVWPRLHPDDMGDLWAETRALLVPSRYETYGMSAVEAAAHGVPSVHVDTPHVREGIGEAARLLLPRAEDLEKAVLEVEEDHALWSARAKKRAVLLATREQVELSGWAARVATLLDGA